MYEGKSGPTEDGHNLSRSIISRPAADKVAQPIVKEVLEDHVHDEYLVTRLAIRVQSINNDGAGAHQSATQHHPVQETTNVDTSSSLHSPSIPDHTRDKN
jgi:hypothetical protein